MAQSVGGALSQGIDTGFRMAMDIDAREEDKRRSALREAREERRFNAEQEDRLAQRERLGRKDALELDKTALSALDDELKTHSEYGARLYEQYGDAIPDDLRQPYVTKGRGLIERRGELRRKLYEPRIREMETESANTWSRIQAGQMNIEELKPADLVRTLTVAAKRDLSDFLSGPDGAPSRVAQAGLDLVAGMETGNEGLVLEAANILLEPELKRGVGEPGKDGSTITRKEIVKFIPHPENPSEVLPVIRVHVKREDGKIGSYLAPITKNRSADPDDEVIGLDISKAMDRAGQLTTLAETLSAPGMRERVEQGMKEGGKEAREFLDIFFGVGGQKPKAKVDWKSVPAGGMLVGLDEQGRQVGEVRGPARSTGLQASLDAINGMVDRGELDEQTADDLRQAAVRSAALGKKGTGSEGGGQDSAQLRGVQAALDRGDITPEEARERRRQIALGTKTGDVKSPKPPSEGQAKALMFGARMEAANQILDDLEKKGVNTRGHVRNFVEGAAGLVPIVGDKLADAAGSALNVMPGVLGGPSAEQQQVDQAQRDFVNAVLRRESGAVISSAEFANAARQYFPQAGDSEEVIRQKARNRRTAIEGMKAEFGEQYMPEFNRITRQSAGASGSWEEGTNANQGAPAKNTKTVTIGGRTMTATKAPDGKYYVRLQNGRYAEVRD